MVFCGISLASSFSAHPDRPEPDGFTALVEFLGGATFTHTKSGINLGWCHRASNYLKLYHREIMALHSGMNVTPRVIHGAVNRRLTGG
jgi:hypothetical protein